VSPDIALVPFGTPLYEEMKRVRDAVLRAPMGLSLEPSDLAGEETQFHIAALDEAGAVLGTVLLKPLSAETLKLRQMAVADGAQGRGTGRALVGFAERLGRERGFSRIELSARLTARGFYDRLGYLAEGGPFLETTIPHILMTKALGRQ
jgi:predicted GNAT family N-acyltransferase